MDEQEAIRRLQAGDLNGLETLVCGDLIITIASNLSLEEIMALAGRVVVKP